MSKTLTIRAPLPPIVVDVQLHFTLIPQSDGNVWLVVCGILQQRGWIQALSPGFIWVTSASHPTSLPLQDDHLATHWEAEDCAAEDLRVPQAVYTGVLLTLHPHLQYWSAFTATCISPLGPSISTTSHFPPPPQRHFMHQDLPSAKAGGESFV